MFRVIVDRVQAAQLPQARVYRDLPLIGAVALETDAPIGIPDEILTLDTPSGQTRLQTAIPTLKADKLWQAGLTGKGSNVAVIDTGAAHKDLSITAFHDLVNNRTKPYDDHGHGTHVAGIVDGVAPGAGIVAIKAFDREGKARTSDVIAAIQWAVQNKAKYNIGVLNLSARGKAELSHLHDPLARAADQAWKAGLVTVVAVGNDGPGKETIGTPAHSPTVIAVGASDDRGTPQREDDRIWSGSSRGPIHGLIRPDVLAPGKDIKACSHLGGYTTKTGTSMAAPMVAGVASLLLQALPTATPQQVKAALVDTAEPLKGLQPTDQGKGLVDAERAWRAIMAV